MRAQARWTGCIAALVALGASGCFLDRQPLEGRRRAGRRGSGALPAPHRDPFDRMLAAQSLLEDVPIVGRDEAFLDFGVKLVW